MAEMMKGGAGSPIDNENMKKWLSFYSNQTAGGGAPAGGIPINNISLGNANTAMKQYMEGTQIDPPKIDYEYNPFVPPESSDGDDDTKDDDDDFTESGPAVPPKPGEPGYEQYMMYEAGPDFAHDAHNAKSMDQMIGEGYLSKAIAMQNNNIPGFIGTGISKLGKFNQDYYDKYMDKTYGDAGYTGDGPGEADYQGSSPSDFAGTDAPSGDQGVGGMSGGAGEFGIFNYGGRADWKKGSPLAKRAKMTLAQKKKAGVNMADGRKPGMFTQMAKGFLFNKATGGLANVGKRGGCPCGTPGCPGCGKGYNNGGRPSTIWRSYDGSLNNIPVTPRRTSKFAAAELQEPVGRGVLAKENRFPMQLSIKDQIAIRESDAKIERENMKAKADVYNKIKGPLQGE